jgi:hypothetical protein
MNSNELIDSAIVHVKGRRAVNSALVNLMEKFGTKEEPRELPMELPEDKKEERSSGLYKRLGIHQKKEVKKVDHKCRCDLLPEILLPGQLLYCKDRGRLTTVPPPPMDSKMYVLLQNNRVVYWMPLEEDCMWFK